uniref:Uncharacterized protein n=1 Tax=Spongospora subterranea TaxID=70186 RepID=A0A0H5QXL3_9EUKA|eukprot:CRZ06361.1 hypothetical protein [Spongospora subterranea]
MKLTNCRLSSRVCKGQLGQAPLAIYFSLILVLDILHTCINHHLTPEMDDLNKSEQVRVNLGVLPHMAIQIAHHFLLSLPSLKTKWGKSSMRSTRSNVSCFF